MDPRELLAPDASAPLGRSRARVLDVLRAAGSPLGVLQVADRTGLHPNTARFHLDALVEAGLASRAPQARSAPGRPSITYQATGGGPAGKRRYRLLAQMLTSLITGMLPQPERAATEAGREWGAYLTEPSPPYRRPDAGEAIEKLAAVMAELGFAPQTEADGPQYRLRLHECPFLEVARQHQDVVCSLHLGSCRVRWPRCAHRSPRPGWSRLPSPASASPICGQRAAGSRKQLGQTMSTRMAVSHAEGLDGIAPPPIE